MTILDTLAQHAAERVRRVSARIPLEEVRAQAELLVKAAADGKSGADGGRLPFEAALAAPGISFICECKKASPSKGMIDPVFPYLEIARSYKAAGAAAISVLTEEDYFLGNLTCLEEIAKTVQIPVLRKDFTVDPYMLYEAKVAGASAVLLICAILDDGQLREYREIADALRLSALVEAHDAEEVDRALASGARIVGVNNRDLRDFSVDLRNSVRLRERIPADVLYVSESGIRTAEDVDVLRRCGTDAVLIGETLMRSGDRKAALDALRGQSDG